MRYCLFYIIFFTYGIVNARNELHFVNEYIDFSVKENYFTVNGVYVFVNTSSDRRVNEIAFPFALSNDSTEIIRVFNLSQGKQIDYKIYNKSILFKLEIANNDTLDVNISYRQLLKKENSYILLSTAYWNSPLENAVYSFTMNGINTNYSFSYKPDTLIDNTYYWERINFMPDKDFKVWLK